MKSVIISTCFLYCCVFSQEQQCSFESLSREKGLSNPEVYSLLQDKTGFLWIGTADGLNRYNGYSFKHLKHIPFKENSLSESMVSALAEDRNGNIWAGTGADGINKIDPTTFTVTRYVHSVTDSTSLPDDHIRFLFVDSRNVLWIGCGSNGITRCDLTAMSFSQITSLRTENGVKTLSAIRSITEDRGGTVWFGSSDGELIRYDDNKNTGEVYLMPHRVQEKNISIVSIVQDPHGVMWCGTNGGKFISFDRRSLRFIMHALPGSTATKDLPTSITTLSRDHADHVWVGTSSGVFRYTISSGHMVDVTKSITHSFVANQFSRTLFVDRSNVVWIGTYTEGLVKILSLPDNIEHLQKAPDGAGGLPNNYVRGIYEDGHGLLWIGTGGGLTTYDSKTKGYSTVGGLSYMFNRREIKTISSVCGDSRGTIWIGTMNGVYTYRPSLKRYSHILGTASPSNNYLDNYVYEVRADHQGSIWVSTDGGGVVRLSEDGRVLQRLNTSNHMLPSNSVRTVLPDSNGNLWVGTFGAGVSKIDVPAGKSVSYRTNKADPSSLGNDLVLSLCKDSKNNLWIGTRTGLNKFDSGTNTFTHFMTNDGLPNNIIVGIEEDHSSNLWISTYYGISKYNGESFQNFFSKDGFQDDFNSGSSFHTTNGKLFFGGSNGLCMFIPESLKMAQSTPPIVITATKQSEHPVSVEASPGRNAAVTMEPNERIVTFEFTTLDFKNPEGNTYGYKLEGFNDTWIFSQDRRNVSYANLKEGGYVFRVKAQGRDGVWHEAATTIGLTVIPPMVERWWFYPVLIFSLSLVGIAFYRTWLLRKLEVEKIRSKIAADLHDEIGSGLARIAVLSDIAGEQQQQSKSTKNTIETSTRIGIISRELMESIADVVWSIDPRNDRSEYLLERIHSYLTQICEEGNLGLELSDEEIESISIEPFMKRAMLLIVKESMNNIIKHSHASHVMVQVKKKGTTLVLTIKDDGIGFNEEQLGRINGLDNMRVRAEASGGSVRITSHPQAGTTIEVVFQL